MKKKFFRTLSSFIVTFVMAFSMIGTGNGSVVNAEDTEWKYSKSKTAASDILDANYETQITLSLPSKQEQLKSDVLFVMDVSSCAAGADKVIENLMNQLSEQIKESNASVRVGLVVFKGTAVKAFDLADYSEENKDKLLQLAGKITAASVKYENQDEDKVVRATIHEEGKNELKALLPGMSISGSNIPAGLACAKSVLEENDGVDNARKHMILISDGATFLYCKQSQDKNDPTKVVYDYNTHRTRMANAIQAGMDHNQDGTLSEWVIKYPVQTGDDNQTYGDWTPESEGLTWADYLAKEKSLDKDENLSRFDQDYYISDSSDKTMIMDVTKADDSNYKPVLNVEKSFFQAADIYQDIKDEGYKCNAYTTDGEVAPVFTSFMKYLAGGNLTEIPTTDSTSLDSEDKITLEKISNDIFYFLGAGSQIEDEMGETSTYNFNFVNDAASLKLTVGNVVYTATKATNLTNKGETAKYLFTSADVTAKKAKNATTEPEAPYVLHYYDGSDGTSERIVWEINEDVSDFARVQLTYSEKLMNPQTVADTYTVATNNSAALYPVDSNGNSKAAEAFVSPSVSYTIRPITPEQPEPSEQPRPSAPAAQDNPSDVDRPASPATPDTGDQTNWPLAAGVMGMSLMAAAFVIMFKNKYSN